MSAMTDPGRVRQQNQDCVHADPEQRLFVLADGVGGRAGGHVASRLAVDTIAGRLQRHRGGRWPGRWRNRPDIDLSLLNRAVFDAHQALLERARDEPELSGMGCTVVAGFLDHDHCLCVAVGDSRLYRIRDGRLEQITRDQTLANRLLEEGFLQPGDEGLEQYRHVLTTSVGCDHQPPEIQEYRIPVAEGDLLLACSDGLSGMLTSEQIAAAIRESGTLEESTRRLIELANRAGGTDNISVILIGRPGTEPGNDQPGHQGG